MDDSLLKILIAAASALIGALVSRALVRPKEKRVAAAAYLEAICASLQGMIQCFETDQVPYQHGNAFIGALSAFGSTLAPVVDAEEMQHLVKLEFLARRAMNIDSTMKATHLAPEEVKQWTIEAKRVVGKLEGLAATIKARA